jgi:long-chain acyl-CoA synthetase
MPGFEPDCNESEEYHWGSDLVVESVLGFPCLNFRRRHRQLGHLLSESDRFLNRTYLVQGSRRVSFDQHRRAVAGVVDQALRNRKYSDAPILLPGGNSVEWVIEFWAILQSGAIVVLGNAWWSTSEIAHALAATDPALVIGDEPSLRQIPLTQPSLPLESLPTVVDQEDNARKGVPAESGQEDDPAVILFTSGTTGMPKGAVLSHRGIIGTLQALLERTSRLPTLGQPAPSPSAALLSLPLFHVGGLQQVITSMVTGGSLVFTEGRFRPEQVVALIEREDVKIWSAVPTMVNRVMDYLNAGNYGPIKGLRTLGLGGSPVSEEVRTRACEWFPNAVRGLAVTYGLSEACGVIATGAGDEVRSRPHSVGRPLVTSSVRIAEPDESGAGEILIRSPSVMLGYWARSEEGRSRWDPGPITDDRWLQTGDIGKLDADGFLYITDRAKEIVIRGGENVATPHVEETLSFHPAIEEIAVVGLPHPTLGEELGAVIVLRRGAVVTAEELTSFAAKTLAYFEVPSRWWFCGGPLPLNSSGKILKRVIREQWLERLSTGSL